MITTEYGTSNMTARRFFPVDTRGTAAEKCNFEINEVSIHLSSINLSDCWKHDLISSRISMFTVHIYTYWYIVESHASQQYSAKQRPGTVCYCASNYANNMGWANASIRYISLFCEMRSLHLEGKHPFMLKRKRQYSELQNVHCNKVHFEVLSNCFLLLQELLMDYL